MRLYHCVFLLLLSLSATAQLPPVPVPVPGLPLPGEVLPNATRAVDGTLRELSQTRTLRSRQLLREHRAELDRDSRGELVVRAEVVALDISEVALARAVRADFVVLRTQELVDLGVRVTVLQTPRGVSASSGLRRLRKWDPGGDYDYNHVYLDGGAAHAGAAQAVSMAAGSGGARIGLIDGGIDVAHEAMRVAPLQRFGCDGRVVPSIHGTAVAFLLMQRRNVSALYAADVYCGAPTGGAVDAVAAAFGWMARERVAVINVSLVGPSNALLERVVTALASRGHLIVAAVGNDGPAAPPLYPAAYDGVVGVTAVDAKHRVLIEAGRGNHVDFAARGAELNAASTAPDGFAPVRGTSFAAPRVSALLAAHLASPDPEAAGRAVAAVAATARDLGKAGRDEVYGEGEVGDTPE